VTLREEPRTGIGAVVGIGAAVAGALGGWGARRRACWPDAASRATPPSLVPIPRSRSFAASTLAVIAAGLALSCGVAPPAPSAAETRVDAPSSGTSDADGKQSGDSKGDEPDGGSAETSGPDHIEVVIEPSDNGSALLDAIRNATTSVHVTMYLLGDPRFVDALIERHQAGVDVKVVLNHMFVNNAGTNSAAYNQLKSAGVSVTWAPTSFTLTHEKCVIIDGQVAWIMTMNLEKSSPTNREFLAVDSEPGDVQEAEAVFAADFSNRPYSPQGNALVAPVNARARIIELIQSATKTVTLEGEELSDYQVVDALAASKNAGVDVRVVLADTSPSASQASAEAELQAAKVQLVKVHAPYIHAKALVADGLRAYIGSANFTTASLQHNRELGVITTYAVTVDAVAHTLADDFAIGL
jgi:phosphatidylserine/phosphatidylglycerophosphate/cardiolipin synthase-like enzyme